MIRDICTTFGHNVRPGHYSRMCFNPLGIYAMSFQSFLTSYNPYQHSLMFYTIFNVCLTLSNLLQPFVDFIYLHSYWYSYLLLQLGKHKSNASGQHRTGPWNWNLAMKHGLNMCNPAFFEMWLCWVQIRKSLFTNIENNNFLISRWSSTSQWGHFALVLRMTG